MPASRLSLRLTDAYRERLVALGARTEMLARRSWQIDPEDIDGSAGVWRERIAPVVARAQVDGVRLTNAYLSAYLSAELGSRTTGPQLSSAEYAGISRDGRSLSESLDSPRIKVKVALKEGKPLASALDSGLNAALRAIDLDTLHAPRQALSDGLRADDRFTGYRRAIRGTCAACAAVASRTFDSQVHFSVHAGCKCVAEPVVAGAPDTFKRLTGQQVFDAKTPEEQDRDFGPAAAEAVRNGLPLTALAGEQQMEDEPNWLTQRPLAEAQ